jgi:hypothetical protein
VLCESTEEVEGRVPEGIDRARRSHLNARPETQGSND